MKKSYLLKSILILVVIVGVAGSGYYFKVLPQKNQAISQPTAADRLFGWKYPVAKFPSTGLSSSLIAYSSIRDPGGIPQGLPVRLQIPIIGVDSAIEDAAISSDGRMDVPAGSVNVAWFSLGPHPGQVGSAVIGGHYGISNGVPFVFYNLDKLKLGDKIYIIDDGGNTLAFVIKSISSFDRNADATTVFTSNDGLSHLNLITCEGIWNQINGSYPQRLVVFADAIPPEGAVTVTPKAIASSAVSLRVGSRGAAVTTLQTALVKQGFLIMPARVAYGYFGALTRAAVSKYQASVGLPSTGVDDKFTNAKLMSSLAIAPIAVEPKLPITAIIVPPSATTANPILQFVKVLFATATDGIITTLLLISIIVAAYKISQRKI